MSQEKLGSFAEHTGTWTGTWKTYFEPGKLADESGIKGTLTSHFGGKVIRFSYTAEIQGKPCEGELTLTYNKPAKAYHVVWIDSFHTGNAIQYHVGNENSDGDIEVKGSYPDGVGGPDWGWVIIVRQPVASGWTILHDNVTPDGQTARAIEVELAREETSH